MRRNQNNFTFLLCLCLYLCICFSFRIGISVTCLRVPPSVVLAWRKKCDSTEFIGVSWQTELAVILWKLCKKHVRLPSGYLPFSLDTWLGHICQNSCQRHKKFRFKFPAKLRRLRLKLPKKVQ